MLVSILTTTYNRQADLKQLGKSILAQTEHNFEWIIIDDGSNDQTEMLVQQWKMQFPIHICYWKQENAGKHIALNRAFQLMKGEVAVIVDSDDLVLPEMVKTITSYWTAERLADPSLGLIVFERMAPSGSPLKDLSSFNLVRGNYNQVRYQNAIMGDYAETFKVASLKQFSFPQYGKEKFLSEDMLWIDYGSSYDALFIATPLFITEYQLNGLTDQSHRLMWKNPIGSFELAKKRLTLAAPLKQRLKFLAVYAMCGVKINRSLMELLHDANINKLVALLAIIGSKLGQPYFKHRYR